MPASFDAEAGTVELLLSSTQQLTVGQYVFFWRSGTLLLGHQHPLVAEGSGVSIRRQ